MRSMNVYNYLLEATLIGGALIVLLLLLRAPLRARLGNRAVYAAWLLVALRLLLSITLPNPLMDGFRPAYSVDMEARPMADQVRHRVIDAGYDMASMLAQDASYARGGSLHAPLREFAIQTSNGHTGKWVLIGYVGVAACLSVWMCWRNARFRRRVRRDRVDTLQGEALESYLALCKRYGVKPLPAYFVDPLPAACLVGVLRPFIAIPAGTPKAHWPLAFAHEICHQKARDGLWGLVRSLCCILHWFNPLVWIAAQCSRTDSELACDDRVTAKLQDIDRLSYANALVSAAERGGVKRGVLATGRPLTGKQLKKRITSIIQLRHVKRWAVSLSAVMAVFVLVAAFATSESMPLPTVHEVPHMTWIASLTDIASSEDAIAYARRFLESPFVDEDTSTMRLTTAYDRAGWRVRASRDGESRPITLRFDRTGYILEYDGTRSMDGVDVKDASYTHRAYTNSLEQYVNAFITALAPGLEAWAGNVTADVRAENGVRCVSGRLLNDGGELVYEMTVQVEPTARVLSYRAGGSSRERRLRP